MCICCKCGDTIVLIQTPSHQETEIQAKRRELFQNYIDAASRKGGGLFLDIVIENEYDPFSWKKDTLRFVPDSTVPVHDQGPTSLCTTKACFPFRNGHARCFASGSWVLILSRCPRKGIEPSQPSFPTAQGSLTASETRSSTLSNATSKSSRYPYTQHCFFSHPLERS